MLCAVYPSPQDTSKRNILWWSLRKPETLKNFEKKEQLRMATKKGGKKKAAKKAAPKKAAKKKAAKKR